MSDFQVKSDAVDVDAIMRQIRARIREKRGTDYTEAEVQELAKVKLEQFLDPKGVRSDLVAQFRRTRTISPAPPKYDFEDDTIYETHRGLLRTIRRLLNPILKLFLNPNPIAAALHVQARVNEEFHQRFRQREDMDPLYYELVHNLALEVTRLGIEVHNMKMRVESVSSRIDFDERRSRALETVVQYKQARPPQQQRPQPQRQQDQRPQEPRPQPQAMNAPTATAPVASAPVAAMSLTSPAGDSTGDAAAVPMPASGSAPAGDRGDRPDGEGERRRRRRRRRRRPGQNMGDQQAGAGGGADGNGDDAGDDSSADMGPDSGTGPDSGNDAQ